MTASKQDKLILAYLRADKRAKKAADLRESLRDQLLENPASSLRYSVTVTESTSERIESLKAIKDKSVSLFNALHEAGCVKEVVSKRLTVKEKV